MGRPHIQYSKTGRELSRRLESFEYIHAENRKPYRHKFTRGTSVIAEPDGSLRITRPDGKPSWEDVNPMLFAVNTPKRRKSGRRRATARPKRARARAKKSHRPNRAPHRAPKRRTRTVAKRARKTGHRRGGSHAHNRPKRRGKKHGTNMHLLKGRFAAKGRKSGARRHSHNPPSLKAFGGHIVAAAKLGGLVFVGKVASGFVESFAYKIPGMTNLPAVGEAMVSIISSIAVGFLGTFVSADIGVALMAGGFEGVAENLAQTYLPATVQSMLGTGSGMSGYARTRAPAGGNVARMRGYARASAPMRGYAQRVISMGA